MRFRYHRRHMGILQRCSGTRLLVLLLFAVPFYNEFLSYFLTGFTWSSFQSNPGASENQVRVLFVADPQIQGYRDEPPILGYVTRWDADRYLYRTFQQVVNFLQPDVVVYLGDLLDEGSQARDDEYEIYYHRFKQIFATKGQIKHVYVSGDNDVGGEGFDAKEDWKIQRFEKYFTKDKGPLESVKFIDFIRLSFDYGEKFNPDLRKKLEDAVFQSQGAVKVLLNHMSLLEHYKKDFMPIVDTTNADVVFTGHTHIARLYTCLDCRHDDQDQEKNYRWKGGIRDMKDSTVYRFNLKDSVTLNEVVVPTCSYRMGVPQMGYGAAVIDKQGTMHYTVLWLPSRYRQLYSYVFVLAILVVFLLIKALIVIIRAQRDRL